MVLLPVPAVSSLRAPPLSRGRPKRPGWGLEPQSAVSQSRVSVPRSQRCRACAQVCGPEARCRVLPASAAACGLGPRRAGVSRRDLCSDAPFPDASDSRSGPPSPLSASGLAPHPGRPNSPARRVRGHRSACCCLPHRVTVCVRSCSLWKVRRAEKVRPHGGRGVAAQRSERPRRTWT